MKSILTFIHLFWKGLGGSENLELSSGVWDDIMKIAHAHGLSAIAFDGMEKALNCHPEGRNEIPRPLLMQWYGQCVQQTALFKKNWSAAYYSRERQQDIIAVGEIPEGIAGCKPRDVFGRNEIEAKCEEFGFHRFLMLMDTLADVVEGEVEMSSLPSSYREVWDSFFVIPTSVVKDKESWFARRVSLFFDIVKNRRYYKRFGYCSMERFLLSAVWAHFFDKEVKEVKTIMP